MGRPAGRLLASCPEGGAQRSSRGSLSAGVQGRSSLGWAQRRLRGTGRCVVGMATVGHRDAGFGAESCRNRGWVPCERPARTPRHPGARRRGTGLALPVAGEGWGLCPDGGARVVRRCPGRRVWTVGPEKPRSRALAGSDSSTWAPGGHTCARPKHTRSSLGGTRGQSFVSGRMLIRDEDA
ncbi:BH3-interacting domain death agonist isoform X3 [Balaenoptera musculus]|uniref:BH3-interacting domain death agonist isoform X3 n=1 Tax=Balaenoptera musculus TaxID=9771 RepID=A0A8B8YIU8_BALMU|nr:BH3-interacting domain death agonist isoform X3 [Balaenoptera musculus]